MLCHYCGFEMPTPRKCSECNTEDSFREVGFGTEALEAELKRLYPELRTIRLDRDIVSDRSALVETLKIFSDKEADALIGTQMVAKGHDFPNVSLVGIVMADVGFSMPDFRNEERGFQLLTQVSGRAGRAEIPGEVVLQSFRPEDPLFLALQKGESLEAYEEFMKNILSTREFLNYPPYVELALLQFQGLDETSVKKAAQAVAQALNKIKAENFYVLGEVPAAIYRVRNKFRYQIMIKSKSEEVLRKALSWIQQKWVESKMEKNYKNTRMIIDVDPVQTI